MSLRVWLPLTKDLRNQGLDTVTVTQNNGTAISSGGKLGSCLTATSNATVVVNFSSLAAMLANGKSYSLACWVKITGNVTTTSWIIKLGTNSCGLWWAASEARWVWNENDNGKRCANPTISADTTNWHHLVTTVTKSSNGSTTTARHYVDGIPATSYEVQTWDNSGNAQPTGTTITISPYAASLNDIRLYDHCLSPMEVKELAKGLVLHYPLNRQGWGQENLVWNSNWNVHSTTPPENWVNWGSPPTREIVTIDGKNWLHVISNTTQFQGYSQNWTKRNGVGELTANTKMTVSFTAKLATAASIAPIGIHWCNSSGTIVTQNWTTTALTTSPKRYSFTYTTPADCVAFNIMVGDNTNTAHEVWVTDIKLEFGEIATPWCPNSSDVLATTMGLNSTTEYDCSGFCNNGTRTGTFTWTSDTSKYQVSTSLSGNNNWIQASSSIFNIKEAITVNIWAHKDDWSSSINLGTPFSCIQAGGIGWSADSSSAYMNVYCGTGTSSNSYATLTTTKSKLTSGWHMLTLTYDGLVCKSYIDGVLDQSLTKYTTKTPIYYNTNTGVFIGGEADSNTTTPKNLFKGKVSDLRIYATALSADDVKSLYQNSAYIDSSGNVYGTIHEV